MDLTWYILTVYLYALTSKKIDNGFNMVYFNSVFVCIDELRIDNIFGIFNSVFVCIDE